VQDVPAYVRRKGLAFQDYLDARQPAVIDAEHCVRLNYEAFFFGDLWTRERFLSDPVAYCGSLTDPVSRRRFRPTEDSPRASHGGITYFFESDEHRTRFEEDPELFSRPGWTM
jgi:YHS domain-containing protein